MVEKYNLLQITNRIQLIDLINIIQPISKTYFIIYTKQANNTKKAYLLEYYKAVIEIFFLDSSAKSILNALPLVVKDGITFKKFANAFYSSIATLQYSNK